MNLKRNDAVSKLFTQSDLDRISAAVKEAEKKTSGEIVPYVVDQSDYYEEAEWRAAVLLGACFLFLYSIMERFSSSWFPPSVVDIALLTMVAATAGGVLTRFIPACKRFFAGNHTINRRVHQRAAEAFIAEEVFKTRDRTGVLIFLSLLEHKVIVVGDSGINAKVKQSDWDGIVGLIVDAIRKKKPADGLVAAISKCGSLLEEEGVAVRRDDIDELPDTLRVGDSPKR
jgi:putative membrane protein